MGCFDQVISLINIKITHDEITNAYFSDDCSFGMLKTHERFRKRGFGRILVDKVVREAEKLGLIPMCHIEDGNTKSIDFFRKLGFQRGDQADWIEHLFEKRSTDIPF